MTEAHTHPAGIRLRVSPVRRVVAAGVLGLLGLQLAWLALTMAAAHPGWPVFLALLGAGALWLALALWRAAARALVFTEAGLVEEGGRLVAPMEAIERVERGAFAFKPSGGFLVSLRASMPAGWAPGLWWRLGRRVGVGGTVAPAAARAMADMIAMEIARRPPR